MPCFYAGFGFRRMTPAMALFENPPRRRRTGFWTGPEAIRRKPQDQLRGRGLRRPANAGFCGRNLLEFEPEKREPVFRKDHAQTKG